MSRADEEARRFFRAASDAIYWGNRFGQNQVWWLNSVCELNSELYLTKGKIAYPIQSCLIQIQDNHLEPIV